MALRASMHLPGINDLFLIVLGTTTITLPNPDGLHANRALYLLPEGNSPHPEWLASGRDREFPRPFHSYSLHIVPTLDLPPFSAYPIDPSVT